MRRGKDRINTIHTHKAVRSAQKISGAALVQKGPRQHERRGSAGALCGRGKQWQLQTGPSETTLGSREMAAGSLQNATLLKKDTRMKG